MLARCPVSTAAPADAEGWVVVDELSRQDLFQAGPHALSGCLRESSD